MNDFNKKDKQGQDKAVPIIYNLFNSLDCTINIEQHYADSAPIDIYVTATTQNGNQYFYAFECKDREYPHNHLFKYTSVPDGWVIEEHKYNNLKKANDVGWRSYYFNTFTDGAWMIWEYDTKEDDMGYIVVDKYTVQKSEKKVKPSYFYRPCNFKVSGSTSSNVVFNR